MVTSYLPFACVLSWLHSPEAQGPPTRSQDRNEAKSDYCQLCLPGDSAQGWGVGCVCKERCLLAFFRSFKRFCVINNFSQRLGRPNFVYCVQQKIPTQCSIKLKDKGSWEIWIQVLSRKCKKNRESRAMTWVSNLLYSRPNDVKGDKEGHFIIHSKEKMAMKIYLPNNRASEYIKIAMLAIKWDIYKGVFVLGDSSTLLLLLAVRQAHRQI